MKKFDELLSHASRENLSICQTLSVAIGVLNEKENPTDSLHEVSALVKDNRFFEEEKADISLWDVQAAHVSLEGLNQPSV